MSDGSVNNNTKKQKKKKKAVVESDHESESSEEELDLTKDCHSIGYYIDDRPEMINQMFTVIKGNKLKMMLPPILKDYDIEKLKLQCLDQLLGMSEKRIKCILNGELLETSSESEVCSDDESESSSATSQKRRKSENGNAGKAKVCKIEETPPPEQGKTLLEILELEMRARAIRALLKQGNSASSVDVDLTEDEVFPTVIKTEPPCEQEQNFESIIANSVKNNQTEIVKDKDLELRNKIIKKKIYRSRQRCESPDFEPETVCVKIEPVEADDEPEEGEILNDEEVVVKQEMPELPVFEEPKPIEGERICGMSDGEFLSDVTVPFEKPLEDPSCVIDLIDDESADVIDLNDEDSLNNVPEVLDLQDCNNDATTWAERWLQKGENQKVVSTSKLVGLVKKRLAQKKLIESTAEVDSVPSFSFEGSVSQYKQLKETEPSESAPVCHPSDHPVGSPS